MGRHHYVDTIRPVTCMSVPPKTKGKYYQNEKEKKEKK